MKLIISLNLFIFSLLSSYEESSAETKPRKLGIGIRGGLYYDETSFGDETKYIGRGTSQNESELFYEPDPLINPNISRRFPILFQFDENLIKNWAYTKIILNFDNHIFGALEFVEKYKDKFDFKVFNNPFSDENEAVIELEGFEALFIMRERTPITKSLIENLPKLKYIMTSGMRNNAIDLETAKKKNIIVCGTEINPNPAAEITWALILGLYRNMRQEIDNMFQGYWQTSIGFELKGKMLGLIGLGKIGTQVAKVAKAFGMEVCAWSENLNLTHANEIEVLPMSKEDLLKSSDIVSIHLVLGERYRHLITMKEIEMMKKTSFLINTSRGAIIKEDDLVKALKDEKISGAGLDVFEKEPLPQDHKLRFLSNALILPHIGYVTAENYSKFYLQMIENLLSCKSNKPIRIISN